MSCCGLGGVSSPEVSATTSVPGSVQGSPCAGGGGGGGGTQVATAGGHTPVRSVTVFPASADLPAISRLMNVAWPAASSVYVMKDVPSIGLTSISKSSSRLREPATGQPRVPLSHTSPVWTTWSLTSTCSMRGTPPVRASTALSQRAWNTRHWPPVSCAVEVGEPYHVNTTCPAEPAAID